MNEQFNNLTPAEMERLSYLAEECSEVIQAVMKIQRHGYESCHPDGGPTNREMLEEELGHLELATCFLHWSKDVNLKNTWDSFDSKHLSIDKWLHHNSVDYLVAFARGEV